MECLPEEKLVRVLVDLANLRGGPDNISVLVARVKDVGALGGNPKSPAGKKSTNKPSAMLFTTIACFIAAGLLGVIGMFGPMVIAMILGVIAGIITMIQWLGVHSGASIYRSGGSVGGPYRRYDARPGPDLYLQLGETVSKLREAAEMNNWMMDWSTVEELQSQGVTALGNKEISEAIRVQAEAVIETMNQLREQNNRSASETAVDL
jgi:protein phosphatase